MRFFLLITRQFICAPNVRSVKRDAAQTRKKSANSNLVHNLRSEFDPHRHLRAEQVLIHMNKYKKRMICGSDLAEWFERLTANAVVDAVECEERHVKQS